ncbi:BTAD domain-containing putative transcriptional regulator [Streptomyces nigra]|uniref:AfsR/SARP family transcriptional regulator n=1 Tax=Streptomyces nigra TaxID=1827580 RepID=UPI0036982D18
MGPRLGVLGPVTAWDADGHTIPLKGPRHRSVLARLVVARGRVVPVSRLVDDLWTNPPDNAVGALRTFVAALRRALEPDRPPRAPARLLVTDGPGYALRIPADSVDARRFEQAVSDAATLPAHEAAVRLDEALGWWRGPAYAEFADEPWARAEADRLTELRRHALELRAESLLALGQADRAAADLRAHTAEHPWRENAWRLLALALYRTGRQADALDVLRRARTLLADELGVDPGPGLRALEADILRQSPHLGRSGTPAARVWEQVAAAYDRAVAPDARSRLDSTAGLLRTLALTGGTGLPAARALRLDTVTAAEELGDPELTARIIGAYDVPAIWTRLDDPDRARHIVAAAERTLAALPAAGHEADRARLLATVALESRGTRDPRGPEAARRAEELARRLDDPAVLAFALNAVFMQSFERTGLAPRRDAIGAELVALSARHGLSSSEILGHLIRLQARCALGDFTTADRHAAAAEALAARHERPLVAVFTGWYAALRRDAAEHAPPAEAEAAYRDAAALLDGAGMPGLADGLPALAVLCLRLRHGLPLDTGTDTDTDTDWGPYAPWARPLLLLDRGGHRDDARDALHATPEPPPDLLQEALWCLTARAAAALGDEPVLTRARTALAPAAAELAGAGSGLLTLGPVRDHLGPS